MHGRHTVRVAGSLSGIASAAQALAAFSSAHELSSEATWPFQVALDEVLSNIVRYGLRGGDGRREVEIDFRLEDDVFEVTIVDDGPAFNPLQAPEPDTSLPLEERPVGGLGIAIIKGLMDRVEYQRCEPHNQLVLRKRLIA
jgi:anti-sigma regulatory factor (Ser/Thr protein kinase)